MLLMALILLTEPLFAQRFRRRSSRRHTRSHATHKPFSVGVNFVLPEQLTLNSPGLGGTSSTSLINVDARYKYKFSGAFFVEPTISWNIIPDDKTEFKRSDWYFTVPFGTRLNRDISVHFGPGFYSYRLGQGGGGTFSPSNTVNSSSWALALGGAYDWRNLRFGLDTIWTGFLESEQLTAHLSLSVGYKF